MARLTLLLVALCACQSAPQAQRGGATSSIAALDPSVVRRLCAQPDSVLNGRQPCALNDQPLGIRVIP